MRILAWLSGAFSAAVIISEYFMPSEALIPLLGICALVAVVGAFLRGKRRMLVLLLAIGCGLGFLRCWVHYEKVIRPTETVDDQQRVICGRVIEYPDVYDTAEYIVVRLQGDLTGMKCRLTSYDGGLAQLCPGDEIQVEARLRSARYRYGEETDRFSSKGVFLLGTCQDKPTVTGQWRYAAIYFPNALCRVVIEQCRELFAPDTAAFMAALLSGDKSDLYSDEIRNTHITQSGLSHIVAVSGMHISFLMGFLFLFTNNRRRLALFSAPMLLFFVAMVGFTPSVCRAAFMQVYLLMAGVVDRENDTPTALSVVLALLLLENPSAAASVGLQLSFAATAGIMLLSGRFHQWMYTGMKNRFKPGRTGRKLLSALCANAVTTFGALVFTTPLTSLHFGTVSLVSPIANLLCLWAVSVLFVGGFAAIILGAVLPFMGALAAWVLDWGVRYIFLVSGALCALPSPVVYTGHPVFALWLGFTYLIFLAAYFLYRKEGGFRPILPLCLVILLLIFDHVLLDLNRKSALSLTALDVGQGQCIILENRTHAVVVDCGSSSSEDNTGQIAAQYLMSHGRERLDAAIITHAHTDHINGMGHLLASMDVSMLILPEETDRENDNVKELLTIAQRRGTDVYWLSEDSEMTLGEMHLSVYAFNGKESDYEKGLSILAAQKGFEALILGDMQSYAERILSATAALPDTEVLVVSHHGSNTSTSEYLLEAARPDVAIISVGYNSYGHPHEEVLQRLAAHDIEIHRTDLEGNVHIHG